MLLKFFLREQQDYFMCGHRNAVCQICTGWKNNLMSFFLLCPQFTSYKFQPIFSCGNKILLLIPEIIRLLCFEILNKYKNLPTILLLLIIGFVLDRIPPMFFKNSINPSRVQKETPQAMDQVLNDYLFLFIFTILLI